ncbi:MAG: ATP-binding protein [Thermoplasmata archaeon]|nr:ATP-binding protein [Thermoplasmata archaeon]
MNVEELKRIVVDQEEEHRGIFERETIIERDTPDLSRYLEHPNILAITGVRRAGKSVFSHLLLKDKEHGYVNFDDERFIGFEGKELNKVIEAFNELYGDLDLFIFDEIQNIEGWELFLNRLRRTKRVIVTGSNAKLMAGELATHLTGRYIDFTLFPFSFREFLKSKGLDIEKKDLYSTRRISIVKKELEDYMSYGGFPEVQKFGKAMIMRIYEDILLKDAVIRYDVRERRTFEELAKYLVSNFGREVTYSKLRNITSLQNVHTVKNYVGYLQSTYLIFLLERFSFKLKQQTIAPRKVYCMDTGIANSIAFGFSKDMGRYMENLIAIELLRRRAYAEGGTEIYYWKERDAEVDFVIKDGNNIKELIQSCYDIEDPVTKKREIKALLRASMDLGCKNLHVLTWDHEDEEIIEGKKIVYTPLWKWLLSAVS